ncbi:hypothetical protein LPJ61_005772 [Coemansia biformis]|uniref:Uncharacterized protein n=1 Tax=Coemansia biformis TaxID=1286918 RepID=A0A9W8CUE8_9FUNG|nr:hypothetical protein LPJ61_005772 [Coemansia biformis]
MVRNIALAPIALVAVASMALTTDGAPTAQPHKRCGGCDIFGIGGVGYGGLGYGGVGYGGVGYGGVGYGGVGHGGVGYGGWGIPFAASTTNAFNANNNFAHFNDDTLYVNSKDATVANNNVNTFNSANVIA